MSDAVVDYFYNKKLAYEYIKRSQQPFALMMGELKDWNYPLYAENDTLDTVCGDYSVLDIDTGETLAKGEFSVAPNSGEKIDDIALYYSDKKFLVIQWTVNGKTTLTTIFAEDLLLILISIRSGLKGIRR